MSRDTEIEAQAKQLAERCGRLFDYIKKKPPFSLGRSVVLNNGMLFHAAISARIDINRHADSHPVDGPARHKQAAFVFKWLTRIQAIKPVVDYTDKIDPELLLCNSYFATVCAMSYLHIDILKFVRSPECKEILYAGLYRNIVPETWAITFSLLEQVFPGS